MKVVLLAIASLAFAGFALEGLLTGRVRDRFWYRTHDGNPFQYTVLCGLYLGMSMLLALLAVKVWYD